MVVYAMISEIEDLPNSVKNQLFDELLDANAQKGYRSTVFFSLWIAL